jgi:ankyrin repeat protein
MLHQLTYACEAGHVHIVKYFLQLGFDLKSKNNDNYTLFHFACAGDHCSHLLSIIV